MLTTAQLWLPILLSAIGVFIASSLIHTVLKWHNADYRKLSNEDDVRAAISRGSPTPGLYIVPHMVEGGAPSPEVQQKFVEGPVGVLTLRPSGPPKIGPHLAKWFALNLFIALVTAHVACFSIGAGSPGHTVFHVVALITFLAYGMGAISDGIWFGHPRSAVIKDLLDALIYAVVSGLVFLWLWPHAGA